MAHSGSVANSGSVAHSGSVRPQTGSQIRLGLLQLLLAHLSAHLLCLFEGQLEVLALSYNLAQRRNLLVNQLN